MAPQSLRAHGALHGCAGGTGDTIKSYFEANSYFRRKYIIFERTRDGGLQTQRRGP